MIFFFFPLDMTWREFFLAMLGIFIVTGLAVFSLYLCAVLWNQSVMIDRAESLLHDDPVVWTAQQWDAAMSTKKENDPTR